MIGLNEYLASVTGDNIADEMSVPELNVILLNSMPNSWYKQMYVQGFDCEANSFKKAVNMFEHMGIAERIY